MIYVADMSPSPVALRRIAGAAGIVSIVAGLAIGRFLQSPRAPFLAAAASFCVALVLFFPIDYFRAKAGEFVSVKNLPPFDTALNGALGRALIMGLTSGVATAVIRVSNHLIDHL
jgi:uncharacterized membrane protein YdcZ (DUF606 family)